MQIHLPQADETTPNLWHFKVGGIAADSKIRLTIEVIAAQLEQGETPEDWLVANQAEAQALVDTGEYRERYADRYRCKEMLENIQGEIEWLDETIPQIATGDVQKLREVAERIARQNRATLRAWRYILRRIV